MLWRIPGPCCRFAPNRCRRRVIDVSGDGPNNEGSPVNNVRAQLIYEQVTINGLVVLGDEPSLGKYYRQNVIGGNGAFLSLPPSIIQ